MFVQIANTPRNYAWGSPSAISDLLGSQPTGEPEAELWLGAHPGSPSRIVDPAETGGFDTLTAWIAADPARATGGTHLPYLLKILAAERPLSLQAHPTLAAAREGFARENAAGLALDAPNRNYKDPLHKPEVIYALSDTFEALCGFRDVTEIRAIIAALTEADARQSLPEPEPLAALASQLRGEPAEALKTAVEWLLSGGAQVATLVEQVTVLVGGVVVGPGASSDSEVVGEPAATAALLSGPFGAAFATVRDLSAEYPGDAGVVLSLLLNRVTLKQGEALFLPAGNIHAYLKGLGVELMAASDNVLRGGLTPKYIDVPELLSVLVFESSPVPYLEAGHPVPGVQEYQPDITDFVLVRITPTAGLDARYSPQGAAIVIVTAGSVTVSSATGSVVARRGESFFVTPDEGALTFSGTGELFLAAPGA
ncbi:type I phosphomannose isomerase catalytic subunit [Subtercola vilae]|uniref:Mannose-6-phosphate isomerase, class I n=1 Tax=Subtercola vilae TaxID=2056433 RepID=A0A4T2C330_9MICO|nr:type I phosphomannose isomerase catalytic subunit [Subtercola vilae]TIH37822.1 mannose-6-phosphate isomerase, class I [Subtercola vilae]